MKALLLIDIQKDYFPGGKYELVEPEKALENARLALSTFRASGLPIIHVQHINTRAGAAFFLPNTSGAEIHEALTPEPNEFGVVKHAPSSFFETNLSEIIKDNHITELVVCGMMTHMCIDTTVRAAKDHQIPVTLISDACATRDLTFNGSTIPAEVVGNVFFASLTPMFAKIISIKELSIG